MSKTSTQAGALSPTSVIGHLIRSVALFVLTLCAVNAYAVTVDKTDIEFPVGGGSETFNVTNNNMVSALGEIPEWISVEYTGTLHSMLPGYVGDYSVTLTAAPNVTGAERTAGILVGDLGGGAQVTVNVTQAAGEATVAAIYVSTDGDDANDGTSWENAAATIAAGITKAQASGITRVYVAGGEYQLAAQLSIPAGISVIGSWDPATNERVQTTKGQPWVFDYATEIVGWETARGRNNYVVALNGVSATIDGVVVRGGHCGGIGNYANNTKIVNCVVRDNEIEGQGSDAGGIAFSLGGARTGVIIENCWVHNNSFYSYGAAYANHSAGGIAGGQDYNGAYQLVNCWVTNNRAYNNGKGTDHPCCGAGGIFTRSNSASFIANCLIANNESDGENANCAGGIFCHNNGTANTYLTNCTIVNNKTAATTADGIANIGFVYNTIIENNETTQWANCTTTGNCAVQGEEGYDDVKPTFVSANTVVGHDIASEENYVGNYQIVASSLSIDKGDNEWAVTTTDMLGDDRIFNGIVDLGLYEYTREMSMTPSVTTIEVPKEGTATTFTLTCREECSWTLALADTSYCTVEPLAGTSVVGDVVTVTVSCTANANYAPRTVTLSLNDGISTKGLTVSQKGVEVVGPIYVSADGDDANDGASWATPVRTLNHAAFLAGLATAKKEVWMKQGIIPYTNDDGDQGLKLVDAVLGIYGGFAGDETKLADRHGEETILLRTAELADCRMITVTGDGSNVTIDGITFDGNKVAITSTTPGGALYGSGGTVNVNNCRFLRNYNNYHGGAVSCAGATMNINHCVMAENRTKNIQSTDGGHGGALHQTSGTVNVKNTLMASNFCGHNGGAVSGAVNAYNCVMANNYSGNWGGCLHAQGGKYVNCTLVNNDCPQRGSDMYGGTGADYVNCLVWDPRAGISPNGNNLTTARATYCFFGITNGNTDLNSINVGGGIANDAENGPHFVNPSTVANGEAGTFDANWESRDWSTLRTSAVIDAGSNAANTETEDIAGNARIYNGTIDIGAYEYYSHPIMTTTLKPDYEFSVEGGKPTFVIQNVGDTDLTWDSNVVLSREGYDAKVTLIPSSGIIAQDSQVVVQLVVNANPDYKYTGTINVLATNTSGIATSAISQAGGSYEPVRVYVSKGGNDENVGLVWEEPVASLERAMEIVGTTETKEIWMTPGTYKFDGAVTVDVDGVVIRGGLDGVNEAEPTRYAGGDFTTLRQYGEGRLLTITSENIELYDLAITGGNADDAAAVSTTKATRFVNCLIYNNIGKNSAMSVTDGEMINCTIANNAGTIVLNGAPAITNTVIWGNTAEAQVTGTASFTASAVQGLEAEGVWNLSAENDATYGPHFTAPGRDYTLGANSWLINRGTAVEGITTDINNAARPQVRFYDIGAYESNRQGFAPYILAADTIYSGNLYDAEQLVTFKPEMVNDVNVMAVIADTTIAKTLTYYDDKAEVISGAPSDAGHYYVSLTTDVFYTDQAPFTISRGVLVSVDDPGIDFSDMIVPENTPLDNAWIEGDQTAFDSNDLPVNGTLTFVEGQIVPSGAAEMRNVIFVPDVPNYDTGIFEISVPPATGDLARLVLTPETLDVPAEGGTFEIYMSNTGTMAIGWSISATLDWATVTPDMNLALAAGATDTLVVTIGPNETGAELTGSITFESLDPDRTRPGNMEIAVTQRSTAVEGIIYVSTTGNDDNDGSSWDLAFATPGAAIARGNGNQVWIAAGEYTIDAAMVPANSIAIYGGFVGTETALEERVQNTDSKAWEFANETVLIGNFIGRMFGDPEVSLTLNGLTIRDANSEASTGAVAEIHGQGNAFTAEKCQFIGNTSTDKGSIICTYDFATAQVDSCFIQANTGAALFFDSASASTIKNSTFDANTTTVVGAAIHAGTSNTGTLTVDGCTFTNNTAATTGGAIDVQNGTFLLTNSVFFANKTTTAGSSNGGAAVRFAGVTGNIWNSKFFNNVAAGNNGGAVRSTTVLRVYNSIFAHNSVTTGAYGALQNPTSLAVNCTFYYNQGANSAAIAGGCSLNCIMVGNGTQTNFSARHYYAYATNTVSGTGSQTGALTSELFVNPSPKTDGVLAAATLEDFLAYDYSINPDHYADINYGSLTSASINNGTAAQTLTPPAIDIDGNPRLTTANTLGAYEGSDTKYASIIATMTSVNATISQEQYEASFELTPADADVVFAYSNDNGATWTAPYPTEPGAYKVRANVSAEGYVAAEEVFDLSFIDPDMIVYVSTTGADTQLGNSWANAVATLDAAVVIAGQTTNGIIYVDSGVYTLTKNLTIGSNVKVYGGFNGETDSAARVKGATEWTFVHPTIINCGAYTINHQGLIDGATLTKATSTALLLNGNNATVRNCTFTENTFTGSNYAEEAACIFVAKNLTGLVVENTLFFNNTLTGTLREVVTCIGGNTYANACVSNLNVRNCYFAKNSASNTPTCLYTRGGTWTVTNCVFENNEGSNNEFGGDLITVHSASTAETMKLLNCTFVLNKGTKAMTLVERSVLENCVFWGNDVDQNVGGGATKLYCIESTNAGNVEFAHVTTDTAGYDGYVAGASYVPANGSTFVNNGLNGLWTAADKDIAGASRVQGVYVDVGAYESPYTQGFSNVLVSTDAVYDGQPYDGNVTIAPNASAAALAAFNDPTVTKTWTRNPATLTDCGACVVSCTSAPYNFGSVEYRVTPANPTDIEQPDFDMTQVFKGRQWDNAWFVGGGTAEGVNGEKITAGTYAWKDTSLTVSVPSYKTTVIFTPTAVVGGQAKASNYAPTEIEVWTPIGSDGPELSVTPKLMNLTYNAGEATISIENTGSKSMSKWSIDPLTVPEWMTLSTLSSEAVLGVNEVFAVKATYTLNNNRDAVRTAAIKVQAWDGLNEIPFATVAVEQNFYTGPAIKDGIVYVDGETGNDVFTGGSWGYAKKTIAAGIEAGSTINVAGGVYQLTKQLAIPANKVVVGSWNPETNKRVQSAQGQPWMFENPTEIVGWEAEKHADAIIRTANGGVTLDGLVIRNGHGGGISNGGANFVVKNCIVRDNEILAGGGFAGGISLATPLGTSTSNLVIMDCWVHGNSIYSTGAAYSNHTAGGISGHQNGASGATITGCWITNNKAFNNGKTGTAMAGAGGLWLRSSSRIVNCLVANNESENTDNRCGGIMGHSSDKNIRVINCTVVNNKSVSVGMPSGVADAGYVFNTIAYNNAIASGETAQWNALGTAPNSGNNLDADPLFVNPNTVIGYEEGVTSYEWNYAVVDGSEAIDKGDNAQNTNATDLTGYPRIMNETIDIGAYEFVPADQKVQVTFGQTAFRDTDAEAQKKFENGIATVPAFAKEGAVVEYNIGGVWGATFPTVTGAYEAHVTIDYPPFAETVTNVIVTLAGDGIIYVTEDGDNMNSGLSWEDAVATLSRAAELAPLTTDKEIRIAGGTYYAEKQAEFQDKITIGGSYVAGTQTKDYANPTVIVGTKENTESFINASTATAVADIDGLSLIGADTVARGISLRASNSTVTNCSIQGVYAAAILVDQAANVKVTNTLIANCGRTGIYEGSLFVKQTGAQVIATNCTIVNAGSTATGSFAMGAAVRVDLTKAVSEITNCLIWSVSDTTNSGCIMLANKEEYPDAGNEVPIKVKNTTFNRSLYASHIEDLGGNIDYTKIEEPFFVKPSTVVGAVGYDATADWHLAATSAAINAGNNAAVTAVIDLAGDTRIQQTYVDQGAYETAMTPVYGGLTFGTKPYANKVYAADSFIPTVTGNAAATALFTSLSAQGKIVYEIEASIVMLNTDSYLIGAKGYADTEHTILAADFGKGYAQITPIQPTLIQPPVVTQEVVPGTPVDNAWFGTEEYRANGIDTAQVVYGRYEFSDLEDIVTTKPQTRIKVRFVPTRVEVGLAQNYASVDSTMTLPAAGKEGAWLVANPEQLTVTSTAGTGVVTLTNNGNLASDFTVTPNADWLTIDPETGTVDSEGTRVVLTVTAEDNLMDEPRNGTFTITGTNDDRSVVVTVIQNKYPGPTPKGVIYVSAVNGDDANGGADWKYAKKTLASAIAIVQPGDEIRVDNSAIYTVSATMTIPAGAKLIGGYTYNTLEIGERSIIDAQATFAGQTRTFTLTAGTADTNTVVANIDCRNGFKAFYMNSFAKLDNCRVFNYNSSAVVSDAGSCVNFEIGAQNTTIVNCVFEGNYDQNEQRGYINEYGAGGANGPHNFINCLFANNTSNLRSGKVAYGGAFAWGIHNYTNCTFVKNTGGINAYIGTVNVTNCLFWGNERYDFRVGSTGTFAVTNSLVSTTTTYGGISIANDNAAAMGPHFVNPATVVGAAGYSEANDWHVTGPSIAVNMGIATTDTYAIDGTERPIGKYFDAGIYETDTKGYAGFITVADYDISEPPTDWTYCLNTTRYNAAGYENPTAEWNAGNRVITIEKQEGTAWIEQPSEWPMTKGHYRLTAEDNLFVYGQDEFEVYKPGVIITVTVPTNVTYDGLAHPATVKATMIGSGAVPAVEAVYLSDASDTTSVVGVPVDAGTYYATAKLSVPNEMLDVEVRWTTDSILTIKPYAIDGTVATQVMTYGDELPVLPERTLAGVGTDEFYFQDTFVEAVYTTERLNAELYVDSIVTTLVGTSDSVKLTNYAVAIEAADLMVNPFEYTIKPQAAIIEVGKPFIAQTYTESLPIVPGSQIEWVEGSDYTQTMKVGDIAKLYVDTYTINGDLASNYDIATIDTQLEVVAKIVTIRITDPVEGQVYTYDANPHGIQTVEAYVDTEWVVLEPDTHYTVVYQYNDENLSNDVPVRAGTITATVKRIPRGDYTFTDSSVTYTIERAHAVVTLNPIADSIFNGTAKAVTYTSVPNVAQEEVLITLTRNGETVSEVLHPGIYVIAIQPTANSNYLFDADSIEYTMMRYPFELTASDYTATYGDEFTAAPRTVEFPFASVVVEDKSDYVAYDNVGTYEVFPTYDAIYDVDYDVTKTIGTLTVNPREHTIALADTTIHVNDPKPELAFNYDVKVGVADTAVKAITITPNCDYVQGAPSGSYPITANDASIAWNEVDSANHVVVFTPATLRVLALYTLTVVNGTPATAQVYETETIVVTANEAAKHFRFTSWSDGATDPVYTFTMPSEDYTLEAQYEQYEFIHTLTAVNGTAADTQLYVGDTTIMTANAPADHFRFVSWTINEEVVSTEAEFVFTMLDEDVTVTANYEQYEFSHVLTVVNGTPNSAELYAGEKITLTANEPEKGFEFQDWRQGAVVLAATPVFEFTMPDEAVTVTATYLRTADPVYGLYAVGTVEGINLFWNHDGTSKAYDVYRNGVKVGSVKATGEAQLTFFDGDVNLSNDQIYQYTVISKQSKTPSEPVPGELIDVPVTVDGIGAAQIFAIEADSVAADIPVTTFVKPSFAAYYTDPAKGKTKKVALAANKATLGTANVQVFCKTEVALFNSKTYNKRTIFSHEYLKNTTFENGQLTSLPMSVRVKKADAAHKGELRTSVEANFLPPQILEMTLLDITDTSVVFDADSQKLTVKLDATRDYEVQVLGNRLGIKNPKAWVESKDAKGKIKKAALKVVVGKAVLSEVTKSKVTKPNGESACSVIIPTSKWAKSAEKGKLPTYESFVISTGKAFDAVKFELVK